MLTVREQEIFDLHYVRQAPYKTVAAWLRIEPSTVRTYQDRIRAKYKAAGQPLPDKRRHFFLSSHVNDISAGVNPN